MKSILLVLISCCLLLRLNSQEDYNKFYLQKEFFEGKLSELKEQFGNKKTIPLELELECLTALSFYPELKNTPIEFRLGAITTTMLARPELNFIFKSKEKRKYVVIISYPDNKKTNLDWKNLSFNSLVGWIGHELAHILYCTQRKNAAVVFTGLKLFWPSFKRNYERQTDQCTIEHNLGFALYEGTEFTINHSTAAKRYIDKQVKFYLSPSEIVCHSLSQQRLASQKQLLNNQN